VMPESLSVRYYSKGTK